MRRPDHPQPTFRDETPGERRDRRLGGPLQEIRVTPPGVQVLSAFPPAVPFSARWDRATELQKDVFFATPPLTAPATVLLMGPTAVVVLVPATGAAAFPVTDVLYPVPAAIGVAGAFPMVVTAVWFAIPRSRNPDPRVTPGRRPDAPSALPARPRDRDPMRGGGWDGRRRAPTRTGRAPGRSPRAPR